MAARCRAMGFGVKLLVPGRGAGFGSFGVGMGFTRRAVIVASAPGRFFPE